MAVDRSILMEALTFSRFDEEHFLSTVSAHPFELDDKQWLTAEHYYQASKFTAKPYAETIRNAETGDLAHRLGNRWLKRKVSAWKDNRQVYMTRALYRKVKEYPEVEQALLATGERFIVETSQYDYYWGLGRDQRGLNMLGEVWMDIRKKIVQAA